VRDLRADLARGKEPAVQDLARLALPAGDVKAAFDLPWPWGGERFEMREMRALNFIVGPLGSGKTRFARCLADALPGATFLGLDRSVNVGAITQRLDGDNDLKSRIETAMTWLAEDGATMSDALVALLIGLDREAPVVIDMVEQGLDHPTQQALIAYLRRRGPRGTPLFLMTRSSAILDLAAVGPDEAIILCPANHGPPTLVAPHPGAPGYEAVATCLATPEVRARTEGVVAWRPEVA
jgi:hypothetical protein